MCRWLGYAGVPITLDELVYKIDHSLVEQSLNARHQAHPTNADGFGIGWYGSAPRPGLYRSVSPAWSDRNLRELCEQIRSHMFLAHVRASTGTPVQQTNCHPFRYGRWLFCHNGFIGAYSRVRRELLFEIDSELFTNVEGTTDSELLFHLALTLGLDDDPIGAMERAVGMVEDIGRRHGVEMPVQMTIGLSDGERLYGFRYASGPEVNTLFVSSDVEGLRLLFPQGECPAFTPGCRAIVSEPLGADVPGAWEEIPPGTVVMIGPGYDERLPFRPRAASRAAA